MKVTASCLQACVVLNKCHHVRQLHICPNYGPTIKTFVEHLTAGVILTRAIRPSIVGPLGTLLSTVALMLTEQPPPGTLHLSPAEGKSCTRAQLPCKLPPGRGVPLLTFHWPEHVTWPGLLQGGRRHPHRKGGSL